MAAGILPAPGEDFGPCVKGCRHTDCEKSREMAQTKCNICNKRIGYNNKFYNDNDGLVHTDCYLDTLE